MNATLTAIYRTVRALSPAYTSTEALRAARGYLALLTAGHNVTINAN